MDESTNHIELVKQMRRHSIVSAALQVLHTKLPSDLKYHVADHTDDVLSEVLLFASTDRRTARELELLSIAAALHDWGFLVQQGSNEALGGDEAEKIMRQSRNYSPTEITLVKSMILDTQLRATPEGPRQVASSELAGYLLDADVSNLGRKDFFEKAELVRDEIKVSNRRRFYEGLIQFMRAHRWYTPAAQQMRQEGKQNNLKELEQLVLSL